MKKEQVKIGETYTAKVSGEVVPVRITEEVWVGELHKGWKGVNTQTGRAVRVKSAQRLRAAVRAAGAVGEGERKPPAPSEPAKAARLPVAGEGAAEGTEGRKTATPRPPKAPRPAKAPAAGKGKRKQVRPTKGTTKRPRKPRKDGKLSGLDAAAKVLADSGKPMRVGEMVEAMTKKGLWTSPNGKTPEATVYAAIIREIRDKGVESRFAKKERGVFVAAGR